MYRLYQAEFAQSLQVPTMICVPGNDQIASGQAMQEFASQGRMTKIIDIPMARHELLQESDVLREQIWAAFDAFIPGSEV